MGATSCTFDVYRACEFLSRKDLSRRSVVFTDREKEVLELLVAGHANKEIGAALGIEERTVKAHVAKLLRKVGVDNRVTLSCTQLPIRWSRAGQDRQYPDGCADLRPAVPIPCAARPG